ncbi:MAG: hypothetical protein IPL39_00145 [Opitutaceae bacterium]|nr:hypothetical protein [Opitutaceae bacterium]
MHNGPRSQWLPNAEIAFQRMLAAIDAARVSVRLEMYIYASGVPGDLFRAVLAAAASRRVRVEVLVDGFGSRPLSEDYWRPVREAGGEVRVFNPLSLDRFVIRDHRKMLLIDDRVAFVGGFNIAPEYLGDGVTRGWFDFGLELQGPVAAALGASFAVLFEHHDFVHPRLGRWRHTAVRRALRCHEREQVLATGPGLGRNVFHRRLLQDLARARSVEIVAAYFVPGLGLRRALRRVVRQGGTVRLLLAGRSDVPLVQTAGRAFFGGLLRAGVVIDEYQPQVLHAKLAIVDDVVFVGSANLDARSLAINYEVMVRIEDRRLAAEGRALLAAARQHAVPVKERQHGLWLRLRETWARFLLTTVDPWLARRQLRRLV